ncbi:DNA repair protein XRCC4-like isoform 1-T3 [Synchiropus picturatus]
MSGTVRKISLTSDPQASYFLQVDWSVDLTSGFTLMLTDGRSAWIGEVSEDEVMTEAEGMGVSRENYLKDLQQALTGCDGGAGDIKQTYSFQLSPDHCRLSYHKLCDGAMVQVGSVDLQPARDPVPMNREMIAQSLKHTAQLVKENVALLEENRKLKLIHKQILADFNQLVQEKETTEKKLYSCFVTVMKEKKAKIRSLKDQLSQLERQKKRRKSQEDGSEETSESIHPSLAPTIITPGHDLTCHGITVEPLDDGQEQYDSQDLGASDVE